MNARGSGGPPLPLPAQPEAAELVVADFAPDDGAEIRLTPEAAAAWQALRAAAGRAGIMLWPLSGFRSVARQREIIAGKQAAGQTLAEIYRTVAPPGHSEHHTGRALDIGCPESHSLEEAFAHTPAFAWLVLHAPEFGFRLSYPADNPYGLRYEPWHWCHHPKPSRPVVIAPYDPAWPLQAQALSRQLEVLGPVLTAVHHIGSTSVPGLAAKPIIDLLPVVTDLAALDQARDRIEALGYAWLGELGIAGRRYCSLTDAAGIRRAQLHFFAADSPEFARHLAFRDYLRAHAAVARAYEAEKRRAAALHPRDVHAYTDEKSAWIRATEGAALAWRAARH